MAPPLVLLVKTPDPGQSHLPDGPVFTQKVLDWIKKPANDSVPRWVVVNFRLQGHTT